MQKGKLTFREGATFKDYVIEQQISKGQYSTIYKGKHIKTNKNVLLKVYLNNQVRVIVKFGKFFQDEKKILRMCKNQNLLQLLQIIKQQSAQILVFEYYNGGTLQDLIQQKSKLTENHAAYILKQILNAFMSLQSINAMHRDFKTEYVYFHNNVVKLGGFSFSKVFKSSNSSTDTNLGTAFTMAPEVLNEEDYGANADIWSIGTVFYKMIFGQYPFKGQDDQEMLKNIQTHKPSYKGAIISENCKDFIENCLQINPKKRLSWTNISDHPFVKSLKSRDFSEFRMQNATQRYEQLLKSSEAQISEMLKKINDYKRRENQLNQQLAKYKNEFISYKRAYEDLKQQIQSLKKIINVQNEEINRYENLLTEREKQIQQSKKLSNILYNKIRESIPVQKILASYYNRTPILIENQKQLKQIGKLQIFVIGKQKYEDINKKLLIKGHNLSLCPLNISQNFRNNKTAPFCSRNRKASDQSTNATSLISAQQISQYNIQNASINQAQQESQQSLINNKQLQKTESLNLIDKKYYSEFFTINRSIQNQLLIEHSTIDQKQKMPSFKKKQIIVYPDNLYFENTILENHIETLVNLKSVIQTQSEAQIHSSKLVFYKSSGKKDLVFQIKQIFSTYNKRGFLVLFQTQSKKKFGIYSFKNEKKYKTILINLEKNKVFKPIQKSKVSGYSYRISSQKIRFGEGEIMLKSHPPELQFCFDIIGERYFDIQGIQEVTGQNDSQINLSEIEVYDIVLKT